MSGVLTISLDESVIARIQRLAGPSANAVGGMVAEAIEQALPAIPPGLTERQNEALEDLEVLSDGDLRKMLLEEWADDACEDPDLLMLRRAYAGALLKWRGRPVELDELTRACPFT